MKWMFVCYCQQMAAEYAVTDKAARPTAAEHIQACIAEVLDIQSRQQQHMQLQLWQQYQHQLQHWQEKHAKQQHQQQPQQQQLQSQELQSSLSGTVHVAHTHQSSTMLAKQQMSRQQQHLAQANEMLDKTTDLMQPDDAALHTGGGSKLQTSGALDAHALAHTLDAVKASIPRTTAAELLQSLRAHAAVWTPAQAASNTTASNQPQATDTDASLTGAVSVPEDADHVCDRHVSFSADGSSCHSPDGSSNGRSHSSSGLYQQHTSSMTVPGPRLSEPLSQTSTVQGAVPATIVQVARTSSKGIAAQDVFDINPSLLGSIAMRFQVWSHVQTAHVCHDWSIGASTVCMLPANTQMLSYEEHNCDA